MRGWPETANWTNPTQSTNLSTSPKEDARRGKKQSLGNKKWFKAAKVVDGDKMKGFQKAGYKDDKTKDRKPPIIVMFVPKTKTNWPILLDSG